jgi:RNA polymerase sigma-70 factor (ECF subfamily)
VTVQESAPSDEALALRAQQGERQAFDLLIHRHKSALYRIVRRYVGDADEAYDLLQDALISVWEGLDRYDVRRSFLAWTRVIALNKCRDFSRRRRFRRLIMAAFASEPASVTSPAPPEQDDEQAAAARDDLRLRRLDEAIAALPALYKDPIVLTTAGGLSQEATAAVLKTTPKAIEMRLRRARRKLIEALNPPPPQGQT